jgi:hypothetical protein
VKVGDLVKYETVPYEFAEIEVDWGIVLKLSRTGHKTKQAQVLFKEGGLLWVPTDKMEVVSEGR